MSWLDTWRAFIGTVSPPGQDTQTVGNGIVLVPRPARSASALPRNLKRLREAKGLSPTQLAGKAGISVSYLRWLENAGNPAKILPAPGDIVNPSIVICLKLSMALGVGIEALVGEREP